MNRNFTLWLYLPQRDSEVKVSVPRIACLSAAGQLMSDLIFPEGINLPERAF